MRSSPGDDPRSFDSFAADYDRFTGFQELGLGWLGSVDGLSGKRALDAGCGSGRRTVALAERFEEVVVTLGPGGALWTDGDAVLRAAAAPVSEVVDSTGAGDAFAAGLLAARVAGMSTAEALAAGCRLAARAVTQGGARP